MVFKLPIKCDKKISEEEKYIFKILQYKTLPITDLNGNLRTKGNATDMGAYENQNTISSSLSAGSGGGGCSLRL